MDSTTVTLIISTLLTLVQSFLNASGINNAVVNQVIAGLTALEPVIEKLGPLALQSIQAIIATVKAGAGNTLTDAQLNALDSISAQVDAAWDTAWAAFVAAKNINPAPVASTSSSSIPSSSSSVVAGSVSSSGSSDPLASSAGVAS